MHFMSPGRTLRDLFLRTVSGRDKYHTDLPEIGDRFYEVGSSSSVWVVDRFVQSPVCVIPHVMIERVGNCRSSKIISAAVLMDQNVYRRDRRTSSVDAGPTKVSYRRRKGDVPRKNDAH